MSRGGAAVCSTTARADWCATRYSDAYHTCYVLSGLSSAQHKWTLRVARQDRAMMSGDVWMASPAEGEQIFDDEDRVCAMHPIFVIPPSQVEACQRYFGAKSGF